MRKCGGPGLAPCPAPLSWGALQQQGGVGVEGAQTELPASALAPSAECLTCPNVKRTLKTEKRNKQRGSCDARSGEIRTFKIRRLDAKASRENDLRAGGQEVQTVFDRR